MQFIEGVARDRVILLPESLEDYVAEDNPVRVVDASIEMLDLSQLGFGVVPEATGRPVQRHQKWQHEFAPQAQRRRDGRVSRHLTTPLILCHRRRMVMCWQPTIQGPMQPKPVLAKC